ncbi:glycosyltransferase family 2 protein [Weissella paramesenteroides]
MTVPLVSIVMGVHNGENTLRACIDSIQVQKFLDWEFIIFNDGSTDRTFNILKEYQNSDKRIIILNGKGKSGLATGLNKCIQVAKGKYIARMDDDDISCPDRLIKQLNFLETHTNIDALGTSMIVFDEYSDKGIRSNDLLVSRETFLKGTPFFHPTVMIRSNVLKQLHGYRTDVGRTEDLDLWFRFFENGYNGANLKEPLLKYHETTSDYNKRTLKNGILASNVLCRGYSKIEIPLLMRWRAFKPVFSAMIPKILLKKYHEFKLK